MVVKKRAKKSRSKRKKGVFKPQRRRRKKVKKGSEQQLHQQVARFVKSTQMKQQHRGEIMDDIRMSPSPYCDCVRRYRKQFNKHGWYDPVDATFVKPFVRNGKTVYHVAYVELKVERKANKAKKVRGYCNKPRGEQLQFLRRKMLAGTCRIAILYTLPQFKAFYNAYSNPHLFTDEELEDLSFPNPKCSREYILRGPKKRAGRRKGSEELCEEEEEESSSDADSE